VCSPVEEMSFHDSKVFSMSLPRERGVGERDCHASDNNFLLTLCVLKNKRILIIRMIQVVCNLISFTSRKFTDRAWAISVIKKKLIEVKDSHSISM